MAIELKVKLAPKWTLRERLFLSVQMPLTIRLLKLGILPKKLGGKIALYTAQKAIKYTLAGVERGNPNVFREKANEIRQEASIVCRSTQSDDSNVEQRNWETSNAEPKRNDLCHSTGTEGSQESGRDSRQD